MERQFIQACKRAHYPIHIAPFCTTTRRFMLFTNGINTSRVLRSEAHNNRFNSFEEAFQALKDFAKLHGYKLYTRDTQNLPVLLEE